MGSDFLQQALIGIPILFFSLSVHEFFHAYLAYRFGDSTAKDMGRLTLNPLAHLDLFGVLMMFVSQFRFGWAKPVPVNPYNLRNPRVADFWISAAGPLSNIALAIGFGIVFRLIYAQIIPAPMTFLRFFQSGVIINLSLAFFNFIPLFPLDGSHMLRNILPARYESNIESFERIGPFLLIALVVFGGIWYIIGPFVIFFYHLIAG